METQIKIATFAPASLPPIDLYEKGLNILRNFKIPVKNFVDFSETPAGMKAFLLYEILTNQEFTHIWTAKGGFGCLKLLPYLEELFSSKFISPRFPTLIGFSDVTVLHLYFYKKFKKFSIHAPMIATLPNLESEALKFLIDVIIHNKEIVMEGKVFQEGEAEAILLGGNLVSIASLCGTPYFSVNEDIILFIEDINEKLYRLERAFLQVLFFIGKKKIKGLIIGNLGEIEPLSFLENIKEFLPEDIPIGYDFPFGHVSKNYPLIIGKRVFFEAKNLKAKIFQESLII